MKLEIAWEKDPRWRSVLVRVINMDTNPPMQLDYYTEDKPTKAEIRAFSRDAFVKFQQFQLQYAQETAHRGNGEE